MNDTSRFDTPNKFCLNCNRTKPLATKRCGGCGETELRLAHCDALSRLEVFYTSLERCGLFPLGDQFRRRPIYIAESFSVMKMIEHKCTGAMGCPLLERIRTIEARLNEEIRLHTGLDLETFTSKN
jgi:ribosomal protein L40E